MIYLLDTDHVSLSQRGGRFPKPQHARKVMERAREAVSMTSVTNHGSLTGWSSWKLGQQERDERFQIDKSIGRRT